MRAPIMKGKVYVMEAGPGDPNLLTVQAVRILRAAEVVLHDDSVSSKILELIPASTQVRNVGRGDGEAAISQEKIHSLLVSAAREGRHVVWLKANDPHRSADTDEDADVLAQAGVDFEVIHGAASAMGAAAGANSR
jgi:siroheme synthase